MPGFEPLRGTRVVALPTAIDGAAWQGADDDTVIVRIAPDEAFAIGVDGVRLDDPDAIVVPEHGFVGRRLSPATFDAEVRPHIDWALPDHRPALAQGAIAGVPARIHLPAPTSGGREADVWLIVAAAYADELATRLE